MFLCSLRYCLKCYFSKGVYSFTLSTVYIYIYKIYGKWVKAYIFYLTQSSPVFKRTAFKLSWMLKKTFTDSSFYFILLMELV